MSAAVAVGEPASLAALAVEVFEAELVAGAAAKHVEASRARMLEALELERAGAVARGEAPPNDVAVAGFGQITYVPGGSSTRKDAEACALKLLALSRRLRELGEEDIDDEIPVVVSARRPSLRVTKK